MKKIFLILTFMLVMALAYPRSLMCLKGITPPEPDSGTTVSTAPTRDVVTNADGNVTVTYNFEYAWRSVDPLYPQHIMIDIDGFGVNEVSGQAGWPTRIDRVNIPTGKKASVSVISSDYKTYRFKLAPARRPLADSSNETYTTSNVQPVTVQNTLLPTSCASKAGVSYYRGQSICKIRVNPVRNHPSTGVVQMYTNITYKVTFEDIDSPSTSGANNISSTVGNYSNAISDLPINENSTEPEICYVDENAAYSPFYNETSINGIVGNFPDIPTISGSVYKVKDYLILTVPEYKAAADKLAGWKTLMGFNTKVISKPMWTVSSIYSTVKSNYQSLANLKYLLIFGDFADLPGMGFTGYQNETAYTDYQYGCMDSQFNDFEQDICVGRISPSHSTDADVIVNKIINYDKNPITIPSYYSSGINCAVFQADKETHLYEDRRFVRTSEEIRNYLISKGKTISRFYNICLRGDDTSSIQPSEVNPKYWNQYIYGNGEEIPLELQRPNYSWNFTPNHINTALSDGAFYIMYRGHGSSSGWGNMYYTFNIKNSDLNGIPVVFSIACNTGHYDQNCFAEKLMSYKGGGAVAVIASSGVSFSGYNEVVACGIFDALYPEPGLEPIFRDAQGAYSSKRTSVYSLGEILQRAMVRVEEKYSTGIYTIMTKRLFNIFGDPSMEIRTERPKLLNVINESPLDGRTMELNLSKCPIGTRVTAYDSISGNVSRNASSRFMFSSSNPDKVAVVIHAHNYMPIITTASRFMHKSIVGPILPAGAASITSVYGSNSNKEISYELPKDCSEAKIITSDITGLTVNEIHIDVSESSGKVTLPTLKKGVYGISLIVDGQVADNKRITL